jgi:hypothetical protein
MTTILVQWILASDNGNPADAVMNNFHFKTNDVGDPADQASDCVARIAPFYTAIDEFLSSFLSGARLAKCFDLSDPEPRVPILEATGSITPSTASGAPCEVAACLSFQAERISGSPQARRRGRVFLGPLAVGADAIVADSTAADMIVGSSFRGVACSNAASMGGVFVGASSGSSIAWCTFSPADVADGKTLAQASNNVTNGWMDTAVDIQRRRGHAPATRSLFTV